MNSDFPIDPYQKAAFVHYRALFRYGKKDDFNEQNVKILEMLHSAGIRVVLYDNGVGGAPPDHPEIARFVDARAYVSPFDGYEGREKGYVKLAEEQKILPHNTLVFTNGDFKNKRKALRYGFQVCHDVIKNPKALVLSPQKIEERSDKVALLKDRDSCKKIMSDIEAFDKRQAVSLQNISEKKKGIIYLDTESAFNDANENAFNNISFPWVRALKNDYAIVLWECTLRMYSPSDIADDMLGGTDGILRFPLGTQSAGAEFRKQADKRAKKPENCLVVTLRKDILDQAQENGFQVLCAGVQSPASLIDPTGKTTKAYLQASEEYAYLREGVDAFRHGDMAKFHMRFC